MPEVQAMFTMTYVITESGAIHVFEKMETTPDAKISDMFRYGVVIDMPYSMDKSTFYGRGPVENYADRNHSMNIGVYSLTADEQFFPYIRPQETGSKTDIRWWEQRNNAGYGLRIQACDAFTASALHYNISDLDDGDDKEQRHSYEVPRSKYTELCIDMEQEGVGGINSWNRDARAMKPHRVEYQDRLFKFWLIPVTK